MRKSFPHFWTLLLVLLGINLDSFGQASISDPQPPTGERVSKSNIPTPSQGWTTLFKEFNSLMQELSSCDTNSFALFEVEIDSNGKAVSVDAIMEVLKCRKGRKIIIEKLLTTTWDVSYCDFTKKPSCKITVPADLHYTNPSITRTAAHPLGMQKFYAQIGKEFNYPSVCLEAGLSGFVVLQFIVDRDGSIFNIRSVNGDSGCKPFVAEAIRVLKKLGPWIPGKQGDTFVKMQLKLPIRLEAQ